MTLVYTCLPCLEGLHEACGRGGCTCPCRQPKPRQQGEAA